MKIYKPSLVITTLTEPNKKIRVPSGTVDFLALLVDNVYKVVPIKKTREARTHLNTELVECGERGWGWGWGWGVR